MSTTYEPNTKYLFARLVVDNPLATNLLTRIPPHIPWYAAQVRVASLMELTCLSSFTFHTPADAHNPSHTVHSIALMDQHKHVWGLMQIEGEAPVLKRLPSFKEFEPDHSGVCPWVNWEELMAHMDAILKDETGYYSPAAQASTRTIQDVLKSMDVSRFLPQATGHSVPTVSVTFKTDKPHGYLAPIGHHDECPCQVCTYLRRHATPLEP
jgi:hypothetical protein